MNITHLFGVLMIFFGVNLISELIYLCFFSDRDIIAFAKMSYLINFILIITLTSIYKKIICSRTKQPTTSIYKNSSFDGRYVLSGLIYLFIISIVLEPIQALIGANTDSYIKMFSSGEIWQNVLLTVIIAPIVEEIFFRGIVLQGLLNRYSDGVSIVLSSLIFGVVHLNIVQMLPAFVIGLMLGYVYVRTRRSLSTVILIHLFNNLISHIFILYNIGDDVHFFENLFTNKTTYYIVYVICLALLGLLIFRIFHRQTHVSHRK